MAFGQSETCDGFARDVIAERRVTWLRHMGITNRHVPWQFRTATKLHGGVTHRVDNRLDHASTPSGRRPPTASRDATHVNFLQVLAKTVDRNWSGLESCW
jgi:hypothetical protein